MEDNLWRLYMKKYAYILLILCLISFNNVKADVSNIVDFNNKGSIEIELKVKEILL